MDDYDTGELDPPDSGPYCKHWHDPVDCEECRAEREPWSLVQNSTGRVIRTFESQEDALFYQQHDSLYPVAEYTIHGPDEAKTDAQDER